MADMIQESARIETIKADMRHANSVALDAQFSFDGISALLLAILQELREIKEKLPGA